MLGYKIYFNGDKFVADNAATEVQTMPCDSTVSWMANKASADDAVEKHNANDLRMLKNVRNAANTSGRQTKKEPGLLIGIWKHLADVILAEKRKINTEMDIS